MAVLDLNQDAAQKVADEIAQEGGEAIAVAADCLDVQSLRKAAEEVEKRLAPRTSSSTARAATIPAAPPTTSSWIRLPSAGKDFF